MKKNLAIKVGINPDKINVIFPGIKKPKKIESKYIAEAESIFNESFPKIITVARLDKRKGHDKILMLIKNLKPKFPKIKYVSVGNGDEENNLIKLQKLGCEYGSTTNRPRQCNWINLSNLQRSIQLNNVKILIINKCDILEKLGVYKLYNNNGELEIFTDFQEFLQKIEFSLSNLGLQDIIFSYSPETI